MERKSNLKYKFSHCFFILAGIAAAAVLTAGVAAYAGTGQAPMPDKTHKCPVCGMVVHRYPDFIASVTYGDGHTVFFDGVKDMFKYLFDLAKYEPARKQKDISTLFVTEYYDMTPINGRTALYVIGSDVYGPMGHELIPLKSRADAHQFQNDHKGRRILSFAEITPAIIKQMD